DADGNENGQLYRLSADRGWPEQLTDAPEVQHLISHESFSPDGASVAFSSNARTPEDMDIWLLDVETGETRPLFGEGKFLIPASWSPDGSKLTAFEFRQINDLSIHVVDVASGSGEAV